jgi:potassium/hydrogen antiporter
VAVSSLYLLLVLAGLLVMLGLVAGLFSARFGLSHLLVFLVVGMAAGVDGPLGLPFDSYPLAFAVGNLALAVILLDGGLRTPVDDMRLAIGPAGLLATAGVLVSTAGVAAACALVLGLPWLQCALIGAIVASTDAAAVFGQLSRSGGALPRRLRATIELESGLNDPMAVFLTLSLIGLILPNAHEHGVGELLVRQAGLGALFGLGGGWLMARLLHRLPIGNDHEGLTALLLTASGTVVYGLTALLEGSGFLAVYLFGVLVARQAGHVVRPALRAINGYTWLAEALMFLLLGLLVTPHEVIRNAGAGLLVAAVLMLLARPLAVALCLTPLGFGWRQQVLVSRVGLRGAVPIVLALYPVLAGVPHAYLFFDIAFVVVLCSLLLQAPTLGLLARRLGLNTPPSPEDAPSAAVEPDLHTRP